MAEKTSGKVTPEAFDETLADPAEVREYYTRLIRGMVHNLNNILTIFQGYISLIEMEAEGNEVLSQAFKHMQGGADSAEELIQEVLSASSRIQMAPRNYAAEELAQFLKDRLVNRFATAGQVEFQTSDLDGLQLQTDARKLSDVLAELVENAFQAGEDQPNPIVVVRLEHDPAAEEAERPLRILVQDHGKGIEPELLTQICIPFFTTRKDKKQKGLGLPRALGILYRLGGRLKFDSTPGQGTTVTLSLPRNIPETPVSGVDKS